MGVSLGLGLRRAGGAGARWLSAAVLGTGGPPPQGVQWLAPVSPAPPPARGHFGGLQARPWEPHVLFAALLTGAGARGALWPACLLQLPRRPLWTSDLLPQRGTWGHVQPARL